MAGERRAQPRVTVYRAVVPDREGEVREVEYEAVADALHFACRDLREGRRRPLAIIEDGVVVYDAAEIARRCAEEEETAGRGPATGGGGGQ